MTARRADRFGFDSLASAGRRRLLFAALYLSEGAPIGFIWWYLPTRLRLAGVPLEEITRVTALLILPWTFKFLWAPLLDAVRARGGSYRSWVIGAQLVMGAALLPLLFLDLGTQFQWVLPLLLVHSLAAATQDVAVDGLAIAVTPEHERGALNGWMQGGMLVGRSAFGGVALMVAGSLDPRGVPLALIATIWFSLGLVFLAREPQGRAANASAAFVAHFKAALRRGSTWLGLALALLSGAGFEAVGAVVGPYLVDRGLDGAAVGRFLALPAVGTMLVGALVGGSLADRFGRLRSVAGALVLLAGTIFALAAIGPGKDTTAMILLGVLYFEIGIFTASSYALFMDLTDPRLGATEFSSFMAATNGCEAWAAFAVGKLAAGMGYAPAFRTMALLSLLGLPLLLALARARRDGAAGDPAASG